MNEKILEIINHYGIRKQLKYFQSEIFELNEAIIDFENYEDLVDIEIDTKEHLKNHITEEIADVMVMLKQMQLYYNISDADVKEVMKFKVDRQIERINEEVSKNDK